MNFIPNSSNTDVLGSPTHQRLTSLDCRSGWVLTTWAFNRKKTPAGLTISPQDPFSGKSGGFYHTTGSTEGVSVSIGALDV